MCRSAIFPKLLIFFVAILCTAPIASSRESSPGFVFGITPSVHIPTESYLGVGYSLRASGRYLFSGVPLYIDLAAGMSQTNSTGIPTTATVRVADLCAGTGVYLPVLPFMDVFAGGRIGWGLGSMTIDGTPERAGALNWSAGGGVTFPLFSGFAATVQVGMVAQMNTHLAFEAGAGVSWSPGGLVPTSGGTRRERVMPQPEPLVAEEPPAGTPEQELGQDSAPVETANPIVTATVTHSRTSLQLVEAGFCRSSPSSTGTTTQTPVGFATLRNDGERTIEDIDVMVNLPAFMDLPQRQAAPESLAPGEEVTIDLGVLFNNSLLSVTEGTRVAAEIAVNFTAGEETTWHTANTTLSVTNRNAMTWDDDRNRGVALSPPRIRPSWSLPSACPARCGTADQAR